MRIGSVERLRRCVAAGLVVGVTLSGAAVAKKDKVKKGEAKAKLSRPPAKRLRMRKKTGPEEEVGEDHAAEEKHQLEAQGSAPSTVAVSSSSVIGGSNPITPNKSKKTLASHVANFTDMQLDVENDPW